MKRIKKVLLLLFVLGSLAFGEFAKNAIGYNLWRDTVNAQAQFANAWSLGSYSTKRAYATEKLPEIGSKIKKLVAAIKAPNGQKINWIPKYYVADNGVTSSILVFVADDNKYICFVSVWGDRMSQVYYDTIIDEDRPEDKSFTDNADKYASYSVTVGFEIVASVHPFYQVDNYFAFTSYGKATVFSITK